MNSWIQKIKEAVEVLKVGSSDPSEILSENSNEHSSSVSSKEGPSADSIMHSGWMYKKGLKSSKWQRRFLR